jgi:FAD/FMN-containing dehydrogenase
MTETNTNWGHRMVERIILGAHGVEKALSTTAIAKFEDRFGGTLLWTGDDGYEGARRVWNGMVDKRPAVLARCTQYVMECVRFAREHDLLISVRGGGHNYAGKSVCDGGMVIDLSPMKEISVYPARGAAVAQAGVRLGEFDQATQMHGLATTLGVNTDTGIAGLTLGGGYGWLGGRFGLACDNLLSVEMIAADGTFITASADENSDLFWGIRGAGANLGVVTSFEYKVHPVGPVLGGMVLYPLSEGRSVLRQFDEYSSSCPDEVSTAALLLTTPDGQPAIGVAVCYSGPLDAGEKVVSPLTDLNKPLANGIAVQPYQQLQTMFDIAWPPGRLYYQKSSITRRLSDGIIGKLLEFGGTMPTQLSAVALQQFHGAASLVGVEQTAFPHRFDHYSVYIHPATDNPAEAAQIVSWGRRCWEEMQPDVERAVYVNGLEDALDEGEHRVREAYGPNYDRLAALKSKYDPTNFLSGNQNVKPL